MMILWLHISFKTLHKKPQGCLKPTLMQVEKNPCTIVRVPCEWSATFEAPMDSIAIFPLVTFVWTFVAYSME